MAAELWVAVFADVHGNLPALQAVLSDMDRHGRWDVVVAAGDLCHGGPDPAAALDLVRERAGVLLRGNTERDLLAPDSEGLSAERRASLAWTREQLGPERLTTLEHVAFEHRVAAPDGAALLAVHANPHDVDRHIRPTASDAELEQLVGEVDAQLLVFGHLHTPYQRRWRALRLFDIAACGLPRDGDRRAVWGAFTWSPATGWRGTIHRVEYDFGGTVLRILDSGMPQPDERIRDLLRARYG